MRRVAAVLGGVLLLGAVTACGPDDRATGPGAAPTTPDAYEQWRRPAPEVPEPTDPNADLAVLVPYCRTLARSEAQMASVARSDLSRLGAAWAVLGTLERRSPPIVVGEWGIVNDAFGRVLVAVRAAGLSDRDLRDPSTLAGRLSPLAARVLHRALDGLSTTRFADAMDGIEAHASVWCGLELDPEAAA